MEKLFKGLELAAFDMSTKVKFLQSISALSPAEGEKLIVFEIILTWLKGTPMLATLGEVAFVAWFYGHSQAFILEYFRKKPSGLAALLRTRPEAEDLFPRASLRIIQLVLMAYSLPDSTHVSVPLRIVLDSFAKRIEVFSVRLEPMQKIFPSEFIDLLVHVPNVIPMASIITAAIVTIVSNLGRTKDGTVPFIDIEDANSVVKQAETMGALVEIIWKRDESDVNPRLMQIFQRMQAEVYL